MCKLTPEGYQLSDGSIIPFDFEVQNISPHQIDEFNKTQASVWDLVVLRKELVGMERRIVDSVTKGIFSPEQLDTVIDRRIKASKDIFWTKSKKLWASLISIIVGLTAIFNLIHTLTK